MATRQIATILALARADPIGPVPDGCSCDYIWADDDHFWSSLWSAIGANVTGNRLSK